MCPPTCRNIRRVRPSVALLLRSVRPGLALLVGATLAWTASPALAAWAGPDPGSNFTADPSCNGAQCLTDAAQLLDEARASLGQPAYHLPTNFDQLSGAEQALVLTDLDRKLYGLPLIAGLTSELNQAAVAGIQSANDPSSGDPSLRAYASDWGEGYPDLPLAYEGWMYDDGPGSPNLDCSPATPSGCWSHRHVVLWEFGSGPLVMGAAAGTGPDGLPSEAMILAEGGGGYHPTYTYTWSDAVAAGAGVSGSASPAPTAAPSAAPPTSSGSPSAAVGPPSSQIRIIHLRVRHHSISFQVAAPAGVPLSCALTRAPYWHWGFVPCSTDTTYVELHRGMYRLRVRGAGETAHRSVFVW
jgi:hypothetical protein